MKPTKRSANDWGSTGNAPAGIQSLTRSFSMYITYVYCAIIEPRLWNIVGEKEKKNCAGRIFIFYFFGAGAEIVSGGRPRPAPPTIATTLNINKQTRTSSLFIFKIYTSKITKEWKSEEIFFPCGHTINKSFKKKNYLLVVSENCEEHLRQCSL